MQRIVVIGCLGAGKSIFAERLSKITGLRLYHLDRLFWKPCGEGTARQQWRELQQEITAGPSWIIEGNYGATIDVRLKRADTVIFLDFSTLICFLGVLKRAVLSRIGVERRPDIVHGCNERLDAKLLGYAWNFNKRHRNGILKGIARYPEVELIVLKRRSDTERFLAELKTSQADEQQV